MLVCVLLTLAFSRAYTDGNDFTGQLPTDLGRMVGLKEFNLADNGLSGTIPTEFGGMVDLKDFTVRNNPELSGQVPSEMGTCVELQDFNVALTDISGSFPLEVGSVLNLEKVYLEGTRIVGNLDTWACNANIAFEIIVANCQPNAGAECSCCTTCCDSAGNNCSDQ